MVGFSPETTAQLSAPLDAARVATRKGGKGMSLSYLEGYDVIDTANRIFGFDGWGLTVHSVALTQEGVYQALVTVVVGDVARSDVGVGLVNGSHAEATEMAIKTAVTDAMKRAFRTFGNQFGNSLYDKDSPLHGGPAPASTPSPTPRSQGFRTFAG